MTTHGTINWSDYLEPGEQLSDVSRDVLRRRRYLKLGGTGTSKTEKKALLKQAAKLEANAAQGKRLDADLDALIASLKSELVNYNNRQYEDHTQSDRSSVEEILDRGYWILRDSAYRKERPEDYFSPEADRKHEYPQQVYQYIAADLSASTCVDLSHSVHLTAPLVDFLVRVLQEALITQTDDEYRKEIEAEMSARKNGIDTFVERRPTVAPSAMVKPSLQMQKEPPKKMHQDIEDVPIPDPAPTLTQLAISNYVKSGGNWLEAASGETLAEEN